MGARSVRHRADYRQTGLRIQPLSWLSELKPGQVLYLDFLGNVRKPYHHLELALRTVSTLFLTSPRGPPALGAIFRSSAEGQVLGRTRPVSLSTDL